ncbi:OmpA family protein [Mangrovibacterium lignilyticum]|uniref:OmpA family protein n=1 Tax=Mangrovibacterium lignilyticum TaxID=2668052 RepID=UPI0013D497EB|nr:OmpA family protein [Mangrovibacterium lignilyticum]
MNILIKLTWISKVVLLVSAILIIQLTGFAQDKKALKLFNEAKTYYSNRQNQKALDKLNDAIRQDPSFVDTYLLAADIYNEIDSTDLQIDALQQAIAIDSSKFPKAYYVLGNAYYRIGKYSQASEAYQNFLTTGLAGKLASKTEKRNSDCRFAAELMKNEVPFHAENMGDAVNTDLDEYWPSLTIDGKTLIFTRLVPCGNQTNELMPRYQEDFYESVRQTDEWLEAQPLLSINTNQNEGAQSVSADGKLIFFTACNQPQGYGSCDIYFTRQLNGSWTKPQNAGAPVNSGAWESQPSVSANGEYLYFVSNRKGGNGGMDIWRCRLDGFNLHGHPVWGKLENLGDSVNTTGNEMSPFVHADGVTLYFASDNWPGLGGNDLFITRLKNDSVWTTPVNLGYPINSSKDEQGMIVDAAGNNAYYSSDRPGSKGVDIYRFKLNEEAQPTPVSYVKGTVYDKLTGRALQTVVELIDLEKDQVVSRTESNAANGEFLVCLPLGREYAFNVSKTGYLFFSENFSLKEVRQITDPTHLEIGLNPLEVGNSTVLRNIFFETDSYELLNQSQAELNQLIVFMKQNPSVSIEIGGHTDHVGAEDYNLILSENRAKAVSQYLIEAGIDDFRLAYKGYGYSVPVAGNDTAEGRSQNRRTEFKIIGLSK